MPLCDCRTQGQLHADSARVMRSGGALNAAACASMGLTCRALFLARRWCPLGPRGQTCRPRSCTRPARAPSPGSSLPDHHTHTASQQLQQHRPRGPGLQLHSARHSKLLCISCCVQVCPKGASNKGSREDVRSTMSGRLQAYQARTCPLKGAPCQMCRLTAETRRAPHTGREEAQQ